MYRVVLDTNVLVGAAYAEHSASARIVEGCLVGRLEPVISPQLRDEYERILPKAIRVPHWRERYDRLRSRAFLVEPTVLPRVVVNDPSDDILVATALAGRAWAIITNDRHLLVLGEHQGIRISRPRSFTESCPL
jgi:putative PIN family toxin of toxin-antitoxin system